MNLDEFFQRALEISLQEIKHSLLRRVSFHVKSHRIGISEGSTRSNNKLRDIFKELKILKRIVILADRLLKIQELIDLILYFDLFLLSEPDSLVVFGVPGPEVAELANH
jgi:hypothetical protein